MQDFDKTSGIKIRNLTKRFKDKIALENLNLSFEPGERIALVGHNGSGKTTLIRCLLGLHTFKGQVRIFDHDPASDRQKALQNIGFVPQNPPALRFTVAECLALAVELTKVEPRTVEQLSARLGLQLNDCMTTPFFKLSGGMKQKLLISLALARSPKVLILDEPTANLDPESRTSFFSCLRELAEDTIILLSSHRIDELLGIVSRLIELDHGQVVADKTALADRSHFVAELSRWSKHGSIHHYDRNSPLTVSKSPAVSITDDN